MPLQSRYVCASTNDLSVISSEDQDASFAHSNTYFSVIENIHVFQVRPSSRDRLYLGGKISALRNGNIFKHDIISFLAIIYGCSLIVL